eukprot:1156953-Pelagomonas_calceolata.AAC.6
MGKAWAEAKFLERASLTLEGSAGTSLMESGANTCPLVGSSVQEERCRAEQGVKKLERIKNLKTEGKKVVASGSLRHP